MDIFKIAALALLGWLIGSLVNYLGDVLPRTRRFSPAACHNCHASVAWIDYLLMQPCRKCGQRRGLRAWTVQALAVAIAITLGTGIFPSGRLGFWVGLVLLTYFGVVALIDIEHRLIMHPVSLAGVALGAGIGIWLHGWQATLLGGLAGFAIMLVVYFLGFLFAKWLARVRKQETDEEALGFGDVALSGVLGLILGWPGITAGLVIAILFGGAGSLIFLIYSLLARRYHAYMAIPYGPFLILAAVVVLFRAF